jgi:hypothetical protein
MSDRRPKKERVRALREEAVELLRKGSNAAALVRFTELERLAPDIAEFPQRAADCHRGLGNAIEQVDALGRAAELYANEGTFAKAIALCQVILSVAPGHTRTQARLAELNGARQPLRVEPEPPRPKPMPRLPLPAVSVPGVDMPPLLPAGSVVVSPVTVGNQSPSGGGTRPKRSLEQMLRLRRAELAKAKLSAGTEPATSPANAENAAEERGASDSTLAPEGPTLDSMLAPEPLPVLDSIVVPEPIPEPPPSPDSMIPAPDSMVPAPESIMAPDGDGAAPELQASSSEPPPDSVSDTAITDRLPPPPG